MPGDNAYNKQEWYEEAIPEAEDRGEIEDELEGWRKVAWYGTRALMAILVTAGLLYLSGPHQALLFNRTSPAAEPRAPSSAVDAPEITLPVNVILLRSAGDIGSERSREEARQLVRKASVIWKQANISVTVGGVYTASVPDTTVDDLLERTGTSMSNIPAYDRGTVNVFLTRSLRGLNGISFGGLNAVAVADMTTVNDFRVLAHEIGHVLQLSHTTAPGARLMYSGANGTALTAREIMTARSAADSLSGE